TNAVMLLFPSFYMKFHFRLVKESFAAFSEILLSLGKVSFAIYPVNEIFLFFLELDRCSAHLGGRALKDILLRHRNSYIFFFRYFDCFLITSICMTNDSHSRIGNKYSFNSLSSFF